MSQEEAALLKMASPMHDIGKVGIPDEVLKKPGKLTDEEFEIMKSHTAIGYNLLKNSKRHILKTAAIVAYQHQEKWNGKGYPCGLAGEDIHIYGRITAIADVFDALGSERVYKKAWELDRILNLFKEERGHHFDPRVVDVFFEQLPIIVKIRNAYSDVMLEEMSNEF
jgi:response regulator RpfG family c-di-GMP phosphodiesterase